MLAKRTWVAEKIFYRFQELSTLLYFKALFDYVNHSLTLLRPFAKDFANLISLRTEFVATPPALTIHYHIVMPLSSQRMTASLWGHIFVARHLCSINCSRIPLCNAMALTNLHVLPALSHSFPIPFPPPLQIRLRDLTAKFHFLLGAARTSFGFL